MKHITVLIKPASSACNIQCQYCFYADVSAHRSVKSFGRMKQATMEKMIANIYQDLDEGDEVTFAFQGGEPTLAGLMYYRHFVEEVKKQTPVCRVHYTLQTNGTLLNERFVRFFKEHDFLIGLSFDPLKELHDHHRIDTKGRGTFSRVMQAKRYLDSYDVPYNILSVLTAQAARHPQNVFRFIQRENIRHIQFIPCLDDLDKGKENPFILTPEGFAHFYKGFYPLWKKEWQKGNYISVKFFDDLVTLLKAGRMCACGMLGQCQIQYVIEADGSVYPCDFYVLDEWKLGNITEQPLRQLFESVPAQAFLTEKRTLSKMCQRCPFYKMCRGGCKRLNDAMYVDETDSYCGYQDFLTHYLENLLKVTEKPFLA